MFSVYWALYWSEGSILNKYLQSIFRIDLSPLPCDTEYGRIDLQECQGFDLTESQMFSIHPQCTICAVTIPFVVTIASAQQFVDETSTRFPNFSTYSNQATLCDIDNDGDLDVLFADGQGYSSQGTALRPRVLINNGQGVFADESVSRTDGVTGWFRGVECGDIDRDGDWDIILANDFYKSPVLLVNNGFGFFTNESGRLPSARLSSARAQFGDVDNDGYLDLLFCHSGTSSRFGSNGIPRLYLNDGEGNFTDVTATQTPNVIVQDQQDCIFGDIDGDHDLDIHISTRNGNTVSYTHLTLPTILRV